MIVDVRVDELVHSILDIEPTIIPNRIRIRVLNRREIPGEDFVKHVQDFGWQLRALDAPVGLVHCRGFATGVTWYLVHRDIPAPTDHVFALRSLDMFVDKA
ncbi:hypothetical protein [Streptomyces silvensis]|uniref:hypothetical protein n=1 Tax=Streptomyces silvensis TaxID=1765722 RepID=UPI0012FF1AF7|nr:hypothetical protein [Streptomyces silvensis]